MPASITHTVRLSKAELDLVKGLLINHIHALIEEPADAPDLELEIKGYLALTTSALNAMDSVNVVVTRT